MSKYTTELRYLIENHFDIGLKKYPIFDESYREFLNQKIIEHYYFREIGYETAGLFKFALNRRMNEIMPYFNQLYLSEKIKFDPLQNVDQWETGKNVFVGNIDTTGNKHDTGDTWQTGDTTTDTTGNAKTTGTTTDHSTTTDYTKSVHSDTPQGFLSVNSVDADTWASDAVINKGNSTTDSTTNSTSNTDTTGKSVTKSTAHTNSKNVTDTTSNTDTNNTTDNTIHIAGKSPGETYSEMLMKYRDTFLNIDMQVIEALADLFMNVY